MNGKLIKAPATCHRCNMQFISPTTGMVDSKCYKCGGEITSDQGPRPTVMVGEIPRRCRIDLYTPAEKAISDAVGSVETAGAHPLLTEAIMLLGQAKDKVADFVEQSGQTAYLVRGDKDDLPPQICRRCL